MASTRKNGRERLIALSIGMLAAAAIGVFAWRSRPAAAPVTLIDNSVDLEAERTSRQLMPRGLTLPSGVPGIEAQFHRRALTEEEVARVLGLSATAQRNYDPLRLYRFLPDLHGAVDLPEHPAGGWTRITNNEGAREDHPFPVPAPDLFVLVTGDSHTEGMCNNSECYCSLLEQELSRRHPGRSVEVYNTGASGYSFYSYLGVIEDLASRKPAVFVSTFYGGNDFLEVLKVQHVQDGTVPPPLSYGQWSKFRAATEISPGALAQCVNQVIFLRENPDEADLAIKSALYVTGEIQRICAENGIDWLPVYLPPAFDLGFPDLAGLRAQMKEALALADADFAITNRLADQLLSTMRERGVDVLDLRPVFGAEPVAPYWSEMHINLRGQELVAKALLPRVEALLAARANGQAHANGQTDPKK